MSLYIVTNERLLKTNANTYYMGVIQSKSANAYTMHYIRAGKKMATLEKEDGDL